MIRCQAFHDRTQPLTQCWLDHGHIGDHARYGDPAKPPTRWAGTVPLLIDLVDRIKRKVSP